MDGWMVGWLDGKKGLLEQSETSKYKGLGMEAKKLPFAMKIQRLVQARMINRC